MLPFKLADLNLAEIRISLSATLEVRERGSFSETILSNATSDETAELVLIRELSLDLMSDDERIRPDDAIWPKLQKITTEMKRKRKLLTTIAGYSC